MAERIQSAIFSVALACGKQKRQVPRFAGVEKAFFQRNQQSIRNPYPHESRRADGITGLNDRNSFCGGSDLVAHVHLATGLRLSELVVTDLAV